MPSKVPENFNCLEIYCFGILEESLSQTEQAELLIDLLRELLLFI